jgi:uncharacterized protein YcfL
MNKNLLVVLISLLISTASKAENNLKYSKNSIVSDTSYLQDNFISLNFLLPGMSYERKIGKKSTLYSSISLTLSSSESRVQSNSFQFIEKRLNINPILDVNYRNYYNFEKRVNQGKSVNHNSGNYVGFAVNYIFNPINQPDKPRHNELSAGPIWGVSTYL